MSLENIQEILDIAKKAALAAGKIINEYRDIEVVTIKKYGGENIASCVVTEVDFKSQEKILSLINPISEKLNLGILTEESEDNSSRFSSEYFWCIDPLDGTLAFSKKEYGFSVSISLVNKNGEAVLGVVYDPVKENLYHSSQASESYKNDSVFNKSKNEELTLYYDQSYEKHPMYQEHIDLIENKVSNYGLNRLVKSPLGGAVMNALSVIENAPALYYKYPKKEKGGGSLWDFAATSIIVQNTGGYVSDFNRNKLNLNKKSIFMNDCGIIYASSKELLNLIPKEFE